MKKLIITTAVLAATIFVACKKDTLQPTTNNSTSIEQTNLETSDDDKVVDKRNKFIGTWVNKSNDLNYANPAHYIIKKMIISKTTSGKLKVKLFSKVDQANEIGIINNSNALKFSVPTYTVNYAWNNNVTRSFYATRAANNTKRLSVTYSEKSIENGAFNFNRTDIFVKQ